jgi:hypothetical protein
MAPGLLFQAKARINGGESVHPLIAGLHRRVVAWRESPRN